MECKSPDLFWRRVRKQPGGCWIWTGRQNGVGYGRFGCQNLYAHRLSYEMTRGPIPKGLDLDHLCRNRICVNPDHLEPVTRRENLMRGATIPAANACKTHCKHGHEFTTGNTGRAANGTRFCRRCRNDFQSAYGKRKRAERKYG